MRTLIAELHPYLVITSGLLIVALATWTLLTPPRKFSKICFSVNGYCMAGYLLCFAALNFVHTPVKALWLGVVGEFFVHQISPWFYLFSVYYLDLKSQKKYAYLAPIFSFIFVTPLTVAISKQAVITYWWGTFFSAPITSVPFWQYVTYYGFFFGFMVLSLGNFIIALRKEKNPQRKTHLQYILLAFSVVYIASWDHLSWMDLGVYPFGYIPLLLFVLILTYTFIKHKLMDMDIFLKKASLVALIYLGLFAIAIPFGLFIVNKGVLTSGLNPTGNLITLSLLFGLVFSIGPFLYARLAQANFWLKSQFSEGLTHELKSPLGAIKGSLELLNDQLNNSSSNKDQVRSYMELMEKNTNRLETYVNDLLHIAQIKKGEVHLIKNETDLSGLIESVLEQHQAAAGKNLLSFSFSNGSPSWVNCDSDKMRQAISNILSNAVKFTKEGKIDISISKDLKGHLISVSDNGEGISKEELPFIFESFYQGKKRNKGSGVGLAIAKGWVEAHGGEIWAESEGEGKGTTVSFTIPV